jgi:hypothetical protein
MDMLNTLLGAPLHVFIGLTIVVMGGAAVLAGRAIGANWKPAWQVVAACFGLAIFDRFLVFALFEGELLSLWGFLVHLAVLLVLGLVAWRIAHVHKFVSQYPWRYERTSLFSYAEVGRG